MTLPQHNREEKYFLEYNKSHGLNPLTIFGLLGTLVAGGLVAWQWWIVSALILPVMLFREVWRIDTDKEHISVRWQIGSISKRIEEYPFEEIQEVVYQPLKPVGTIFMAGAPHGFELLIRRSNGVTPVIYGHDELRIETMNEVFNELRRVLPSKVKFRKSTWKRISKV